MTENKIKTGAGDGGPFFRFIRLFHFIRLVLSGSFYLARGAERRPGLPRCGQSGAPGRAGGGGVLWILLV